MTTSTGNIRETYKKKINALVVELEKMYDEVDEDKVDLCRKKTETWENKVFSQDQGQLSECYHNAMKT